MVVPMAEMLPLRVTPFRAPKAPFNCAPPDRLITALLIRPPRVRLPPLAARAPPWRSTVLLPEIVVVPVPAAVLEFRVRLSLLLVEVILAFRLMLLPAFSKSVLSRAPVLVRAEETVMSWLAASVTSVVFNSVANWPAVIRLVAPE